MEEGCNSKSVEYSILLALMPRPACMQSSTSATKPDLHGTGFLRHEEETYLQQLFPKPRSR